MVNGIFNVKGKYSLGEYSTEPNLRGYMLGLRTRLRI